LGMRRPFHLLVAFALKHWAAMGLAACPARFSQPPSARSQRQDRDAVDPFLCFRC